MVSLLRLVPLLAIDAVLVIIPTRLTACTAPSELSLLVLLITVLLVPLELSPETLVPLLALNALLVLMLLVDPVAITAPQEPSLQKVLRTSETVSLAPLEALLRTLVPLIALSALLVTTNSTEPSVMLALKVLSPLKLPRV